MQDQYEKDESMNVTVMSGGHQATIVWCNVRKKYIYPGFMRDERLCTESKAEARQEAYRVLGLMCK